MTEPAFISLLSIAGSDCSGGAGIQADIKTCCAFGIYAATAVTAVTAQTFSGVREITEISPAAVEQQLQAVFDSMTPRVIKTGMLPSAECVRRVSGFLESRAKGIPVVVDPVLAATAGKSLSGDTATTADAMATRLFPIADFVTPNLHEAEYFLGKPYGEYSSQEDMAIDFCSQFRCRAVVLKGGHTGGDTATDVLTRRNSMGGYSIRRFPSLRLPGVDRHGTGCAFSTALSCALALGHMSEEAVRTAKDYLYTALKESPADGFRKDCGPLNFFKKNKI